MADTSASRSMAVPLAAFAAGAVVAVLLGFFGKVHGPTLDGTWCGARGRTGSSQDADRRGRQSSIMIVTLSGGLYLAFKRKDWL